VDGYTQLVSDRVRAGWSCHLVTIVFSQLPGPRSTIISRMKDEVQRVYSTLLTRVHRKPRTASTDELPLLVGVMDLPVYKRDRASGPMVLCNGGLHVHALMLMPPASRLKESLADHFRDKPDLYAGSGRSIQRIDVRPVVSDHGRVVDYVLKTVLNGRLSYDEAVLVLPRSRGELATGAAPAILATTSRVGLIVRGHPAPNAGFHRGGSIVSFSISSIRDFSSSSCSRKFASASLPASRAAS
jgi:hypothetical protein